ncbi:zinc-dependent metalloprotease [Corynebacterium genitalium ATCC 33030]|uniref:Hydrolase n=1 Tax=Corynebacterium genitalium ATCC 33030 TaxID=585529 RepID=D7W9R1_9CORY|nr:MULTISPECIES: zinc-dependent metalloprotease [Corynebacterium]EFK54754.1 putative hydrolase [Corynebacterium genitalium ATCC 33030]MCQ4623900.1 zinc-dependent metalloprotease [Corynebacterium sp. CCUG 70398]UUA89935.1 zinc-dependent metalloprotease [Corynebacterium genitalium ATCC 33030]
MVNGFGFSFPNDDRDDRDDRDGQDGNGRNDGNGRDDQGRQDNPFGQFGFGIGGTQGFSGGFGNLGEVLGQFSEMLSGLGEQANKAGQERPKQDAVNYDVALRAARQVVKNPRGATAGDTNAVTESTRLANLWIDDATALPDSGSRPEAWSADDWLTNTLPTWKRMVSPVAEHMGRAQLDAMPEEAREIFGPITQMLGHFNSMNFGAKLGQALGDLANQALTGNDFGLPVAPKGVIGIVPKNIEPISEQLSVPGQEVLVYISAREAARQRLFTHVPWLVERIVSSVEEYSVGLELDTSHIEEKIRDLNLESGDPAKIQEAMQEMQGADMSPRVTSRNAAAADRLETLLALVEGWVEVVVEDALGSRIPSTAAMTESWARRRATGGSAENAFANVVGIELGAPKTNEAADLWRRATTAVGAERRDKVWDHPDLLPTGEHLENPAAFIDTLLDDAPDDQFDEEIAKLEEMLAEEPGPSEDDRGTDGSSGTEDDKND